MACKSKLQLALFAMSEGAPLAKHNPSMRLRWTKGTLFHQNLTNFRLRYKPASQNGIPVYYLVFIMRGITVVYREPILFNSTYLEALSACIGQQQWDNCIW